MSRPDRGVIEDAGAVGMVFDEMMPRVMVQRWQRGMPNLARPIVRGGE
ncbi:hypothetical protein AB0B25_09930 [Nocardia sp. NPDC049190]